MRRVLPALCGTVCAALLLAGCTAQNSSGPAAPHTAAAVPTVDPGDDTPVGTVAAGITFGTQVALHQVPTGPVAQARQDAYLTARTAAVDALFAARAAAVRHHDRAAFLATVDPADPAFLARQAQLYANLAALPIGTYAISQDGTTAYPPPEPSTRDTGLDVYVPRVVVRQTLAGWDSGPVVDTYVWTLLRRDGRWRLASTSDEAALAVPTADEPWDLGAIGVDRAGTVLVVSNGLTATQRTALRTLATQAVTDDRRYLPSWDGRVVLYVGRDTTLFDALFRGAAHPAGSYAGAEVPLVDPGGTLVGTRVLVSPDDVKLTDTSRSSAEALLLRHELTHVALAPMQGPARPLWITEGTAEWVSYEPYPYSARYEAHQRAHALGTAGEPGIPDDGAFSTGGDATLTTAYLDAWLVCADIVRHSGEAGLLRLYAAASALPAADAESTAALDRVLRQTIGLSAAQLEARYRADLSSA